MPNIETDSSRQESVTHTIARLFPDKWFFVFMFEIHLITVLFCVFLHKFLSVYLDFLSLLGSCFIVICHGGHGSIFYN